MLGTCVLSPFSHILLCETLWTVGHQVPLSTGFSRQEYWSGSPCPPPGDLPNPGIEPPCLVPHLRGSDFSFSPVSMILAVVCYIWSSLCWAMFPLCPFWRIFIINGCWNLSEAFSASTEMIIWLLFFNLLYHTDLFAMLKKPWIPGMNPTWSWDVILLMYY